MRELGDPGAIDAITLFGMMSTFDQALVATRVLVDEGQSRLGTIPSRSTCPGSPCSPDPYLTAT